MKELWTRIWLDPESNVIRIENPDDSLFFGVHPPVGYPIGNAAGVENRKAADTIAEAIGRARREKRNVRFEYHSTCPAGEGTYVCAHIEYLTDGKFCLHATALDPRDRQPVPQAEEPADEKIRTQLKAIYDNLPIGVEIYDHDGKMIDINPHELAEMGIPSKEDVLGVNLFENPNLPKEITTQLKAGNSVRFSQEYDFGLISGYFKSSKNSVHSLDVIISVLHDQTGAIDKFLTISQDVTERVHLQRKYEILYNQNMTVLNSLPVGVGIYDDTGSSLYFNRQMCRIFGIDELEAKEGRLNLNENPTVPREIKTALLEGTPIHMRFPYNFDAVRESGYMNSSHSHIHHIDCNGSPVFNTAGQFENYVFIINDVTEIVRSEEELRQSKLKTELAIRDSNIVLWEYDVREKQFFSDNEPMNGYDRSKPISIEKYTETVHPEDRALISEKIQRMVNGEDFSFSVDGRILFPDNPEWQSCTVAGSPFERDRQGRVLKYVGTRKNDTELQKRQLLQDRILNSIPLPIHIKDVEDNFRYVFCNEESKRLFGTSEEKTSSDLLSDSEVTRIQKTDLEVFSTGKPYFGLEHIVIKDGRSYDMIVRKSIIHDGNKRLLLNIRWDQSLQNDLERRSKLLSMTMETMNAYSWFFEPGKNRISFGDGFAKICHDPSAVNTVETFAASIHPEDRERFTSSLEAVTCRESGEWLVEFRVDLEGSGEYKWWEARGILETTTLNDAPYKFLFGMSICIESHKQTELTLVKNKEELKHLIRQNELVLNNTNSGLAYITTDYIVQWENISMCSASLSYEAYKKGEACYKSAHNRTTPCENCVMQRAIRSGQVEQIKFRLDNHHVVEIFATPVIKENGIIDGIVIRMDNVTEREGMIADLRHAKALAEQSDKLKSAFLANMSHEIRTPLNAIVGFSELLQSTEDEAEKEEYIRIINNNNDLLLKLISDILDLSKIEAGSVELKYEEFDLSEYFNGMASSMKQRVTKPNVLLVATNPYPCCRVNLDRNRVAQILTNYVTNAIKYTPKGFIEMGYERIDEGIRFFVKDSGIGIPDEKKEKVFHRFEKLDDFAQGTGLGLSICKAIAESMGGSVGFESVFGEGSLFWAILPCDVEIDNCQQTKQETQHPGKSDSPTTVSDTKRKTILVAEDIPSNYLLVSAILQKHFDLLHAENGQQAIDLLRGHKVDLVLMDMKMPVMDGLTATQQIRLFDRRVPIIALTAHAFEADRLAALAAGCDEYLIKPIDKVKLMAVLRKYCGASSFEKAK